MVLKQMLIKPSDKQLAYNITYSDLTRPLAGPLNPFKSASEQTQKKNVLTGYAEPQEFSEAAFRTQSRTFQAYGYAKNPSLHLSRADEFIGDVTKAIEMQGQNIVEVAIPKKETTALRKTREKKGDPAVLVGDNAYKGPWAAYNVNRTPTPEPEALGSDEEYEEDSLLPVVHDTKTVDDTSHEHSEFNAKEEYDYMGRSRIMHVPQDLDVNLLAEPGKEECFIPKRLIHTWNGHHKGTTVVRFFPKSGHMLLSGGNDNKIRVLVGVCWTDCLDMGCVSSTGVNANILWPL
jgi:pre-mRNA-processing factor 17